MKAAAANADKAVEDWKMAVLDREYLDKTQAIVTGKQIGRAHV